MEANVASARAVECNRATTSSAVCTICFLCFMCRERVPCGLLCGQLFARLTPPFTATVLIHVPRTHTQTHTHPPTYLSTCCRPRICKGVDEYADLLAAQGNAPAAFIVESVMCCGGQILMVAQNAHRSNQSRICSMSALTDGRCSVLDARRSITDEGVTYQCPLGMHTSS